MSSAVDRVCIGSIPVVQTMKITLLVPKDHNKETVLRFLKTEIAEARNIKDKNHRKLVESALNMIKTQIIQNGVGHAYYSDGITTVSEEYDQTLKIYWCGKDFIRPEKKEIFRWLLVCFDAQDLYIGEFNGKEVQPI